MFAGIHETSRSNAGDRLSIGSDHISQYAVVDIAGIGDFSHVYKAVAPTTSFSSPIRNIAMKRYHRSNERRAQAEIAALSELKHSSYFVTLYGAFNFNGELVLATELLGYSIKTHSLLENNVHFTQETHEEIYLALAKIAKQLLCAAVTLNSEGFIHADLQPNHVLLVPGHKHKIKLISLSNAFRTRDIPKFGGRSGDAEMFDNVQPNICYRAPEIIVGDSHFDSKIDVWSIGVILLELYIQSVFAHDGDRWTLLSPNMSRLEAINSLVNSLGSINYTDTTELKMFELGMNFRIKDNSSPSVLSLLVSDKPGVKNGAVVFVLSLLAMDHKKRPTAAEALRHPFLTRYLLDDWGKQIMIHDR